MSNLPAGFSITSIDGARCTAVPRSATSLTGSLASQAATLTTSPSSSSATPTPNNNPAVAPAVATSKATVSPSVTKPSSSQAGITATSQASTAPIVGGVVGSAVFIGLIGILFFILRRRRKNRESLLTPLNTGRRSSFYDNDDRPIGRGEKWKNVLGSQTDRVRNLGTGIKSGLVGFGASVKSKVAGDGSDAPGVNLNRGNSQFLDGPIPQHSRNNSTFSNSAEKTTLKDKAAEFFERIKDKFGKKTEPEDPFASARSMTEKQASTNGAPDFSQLLAMEDRDLQLQAERRRASFSKNTNSIPQLGSLGLDFRNIDDPFADPIRKSTANKFRLSKQSMSKADPFADPQNPFADPTRPQPAISKTNAYIADIRRSRGQSMDKTKPTRPPSSAVGSRYPSTIAPTRDSYRDTMFSSFSANVRKGKGRSDPFDLERPELWSSRENSQSSNLYPNPLVPALPNGNPNPLRMSSVQNVGYAKQNASGVRRDDSRFMSTATYASKYSSGVSSLGGDWGDPGPDLGPGSSSSSMKGNAGSPLMGSSADEIQNWDEKTRKDDVSPVSPSSTKNGVGKAM